MRPDPDANDTSLHQSTRYLGRLSRKRTGLIIAEVKCGERVATYYVPLMRPWGRPDCDLVGEASRMEPGGGFTKLHGDELETVLFFARRGFNNLRD